MDRLIRTVKDHYLHKLDDQTGFFTPEMLSDFGFPDFLVNGIRLELMQKLQDSVRPPVCDWADMQAGPVRQAWEQFLQAIHEEIRLPANSADSVLESVLGDIMELMITPRAFIPEYLFGSENVLDLPTIRKRCEWIVIYTYFGTAIPRFMEKRGRNELTKEQAVRIIERLDELVTAHYTSLNWAQLFDPWFSLLGESIEPNLLGKFFRDKGKPGVAKLIDAEPKAITRTRLIEILSMPQLEDDAEGLDEVDEQFLADLSVKSPGDSGMDVVSDNISRRGYSNGSDEPGHQEQDDIENKTAESKMFGSGDASGESADQEESDEGRKKPEETNKDRIDQENLLARFQSSDDEEEQPLYSRLKTDSAEEDNQPLYSQLKKYDDESSEDEPIWRRFTDYQSQEENEPIEENSRKLQDSGSKGDQPDISDIRSHVKDMEEEFIQELFGGDENVFIEALEQIAKHDSWKQAGTFISREIFDRNMVDIYSDTAIYFTDRMQTYFLDRKD
ncbi:MAG: hypothetical protein WD097_07265 [Balneolales bacterium]